MVVKDPMTGKILKVSDCRSLYSAIAVCSKQKPEHDIFILTPKGKTLKFDFERQRRKNMLRWKTHASV